MPKRKLTWIGIAIIIILVAAVAGTVYKFSIANIAAPAANKEKILITFYLESTSDSSITPIKAGDSVRETIQNSDFGKVIKIEPGPSIFWESASDGQLVSSSREGYSSLYLTMEAEGILSNTGISIDKSVYSVGMTVSLYAGNSMLNSGRISAVSKVQK